MVKMIVFLFHLEHLFRETKLIIHTDMYFSHKQHHKQIIFFNYKYTSIYIQFSLVSYCCYSPGTTVATSAYYTNIIQSAEGNICSLFSTFRQL